MKQKRLKSLLTFLLVLCMAFSVQPGIVFAQEEDDTVVQNGDPDTVTDTTDGTKITDTNDGTESTDTTDTAGKDSVTTDTGKGASKLKRNIAPKGTGDDPDEEIAPQANDPITGNCGATDGDNVTWTLEPNATDPSAPTYTLIISGQGSMADYGSGTGMPWNNYKTSITSVQIEDGITRIGDRSFMSCSNVSEISISDSVTEYGTNCFHSCTSLTSLNVGANVSSIGQIGIYLDTLMTSLTVDSGNANYASVDNWLYKLNDNGTASLWQTPAGAVKDLTLIQIPETITWNGTTYTVTSIGSAESGGYTLSGAKAVTEVTFSANLTEIGNTAFSDCTELQTISLENISVLGGAFGGCSSLTNITLSDTLEKLPNNIFNGCTSLTEISIPESVTEIGRYAFCKTGLTELNIPENVKSIGDFAFSNCGQLQTITGGAGLENLKTAGSGDQANKGYVFGSCPNLKTVNLVGTTGLTIPANTFGNNNSDAAPIESFTLTNGTFSEGFVFFSKTLKTLELGEGVDGIPENICKDQTALENVKITGAKTIGASAFSGCSSLKSVEFGNGLTSLGASSFAYTALSEIYLPASVNTIGSYAFDHCNELKVFSAKSNTLTIGSAALNANKNMIALDLSAVESLTLPGGDPIAINRIGAKIVTCYISSKDIQSQLSNQFTTGTAYFAVANGGTFTDNTEFTEGTLATPTRANYKFIGWYTKDGANDEWGDQITGSNTLSTNAVYYAKWEAKKSTTITINDSDSLSKTYDGNAVSLSDSDCTIKGGTDRTVTFSYQVYENDEWKDIDSAPVNTGKYRVMAVVAENDEYASATSDWKEFTISKATPKYTVPADLTAVAGQTLADVKLPDGFTWQDDSTTSVGDAGTHTFKATYTPADTENYNTVENIEVTLTVYPKAEVLNAAPTITATDKTLTVGDAFDPLDGVSASDTEDGNLTDKITVENNTVDTAKAGTYTVTYKVADSKDASCTKTVYVTVNPKMEVLNEIPVINATDKTLTVGDKFTAAADVTATDKEDGDITKDIKVINNTVDTSKAGTYEVTYKVTDSQGASTTKTITVTVKEKTAQNSASATTTTNTDKKTTPASNSPKTGDSTNMGVWIALVVLSGGLLAVITGMKRKRKLEK